MRRDGSICKELLKDRQKVKSRYTATIYWLSTHSDPDGVQLLGSPPPSSVVYIFAAGWGFQFEFSSSARVCSRKLF